MENSKNQRFNKKLLLYSLLVFFFFSVGFSSWCSGQKTKPCYVITTVFLNSDFSCSVAGKSARSFLDFQEYRDKKKDENDVEFKSTREVSWSFARRYLIGPGSSPPRCTSKCGHCTPCEPVHVSVPPGLPVTAEYYPEAWRCKCGNKLYMP